MAIVVSGGNGLWLWWSMSVFVDSGGGGCQWWSKVVVNGNYGQ